MKVFFASSLLLLLAGVTALAAPTQAPYPLGVWKSGDNWRLLVENYAGETGKEAAKGASGAEGNSHQSGTTYDMDVLVAGVERRTDITFWRLDFTVTSKAVPADVARERYRVMIEQNTGWSRQLLLGSKPQGGTITSFERAAVVTAAPTGFPIEIFPFPAEPEVQFKGKARTLTLRKQTTGQDILLEAAFLSVAGEKVVVRQKWTEGEKWWREYERFRNGRKELTARLAPRQVAKNTDTGKPVPTTPDRSQSETAKRSNRGLRSDPRLQSRVNLHLSSPDVETILKVLREASGSRLTTDANVPQNTPVWGSASGEDIPVWAVMEQLERATGGRWTAEGDGYCLYGPLLVTTSWWSGGNLLWMSTAFLGIVCLLLGLRVWWMRRNASDPASQG